LTDDGKYLLVGNFNPHTAVLLDTDTFEIVKEYKIETTLNGEEITSRVGGIAQSGSKLYVVIKDANQVWVIDTAQDGFPIIAKYEDMGQKNGVTTPPLHDIYLTPDAKYLIAAVQDAAVAWVLDIDTGNVVAEIPTGKTPHTGPGATVDNLTFVPTLDDDGIVSVIDTNTWENVMDIKTGGPSLFIRHNPQAESSHEYKYVWAETAFGDRHDEIYLINLDWVKEKKANPIEFTLRPVPGESSWHPEFTHSGEFVYIVSMTGNQVVVYDANTIEVVARIQSGTPSSVINVGSRTEEPGL
ncbi:MAG: cytochrome D1 domain-containing protein, partial [Anaerolineales bacterium]|nr:cytochrome D1 domain-containing protein [Anaerolineales bacterium]